MARNTSTLELLDADDNEIKMYRESGANGAGSSHGLASVW